MGRSHPLHQCNTCPLCSLTVCVKVFLTAAELMWTIVGTYFTVHDYLNCYDEERARSLEKPCHLSLENGNS